MGNCHSIPAHQHHLVDSSPPSDAALSTASFVQPARGFPGTLQARPACQLS